MAAILESEKFAIRLTGELVPGVMEEALARTKDAGSDSEYNEDMLAVGMLFAVAYGAALDDNIANMMNAARVIYDLGFVAGKESRDGKSNTDEPQN